MFDEVTKREGGKRAAQRSAWIAGSTAVQVALVAAIIFASAALAKRVTETPVVDVKLVRAAPQPPAPPPPPPPPARKAPQKPKTDVKPKPRQAMVQPKEVPQELKPPEQTPPEPEEDTGDEGVEGGVIGGVAGGTIGGAPAPPAPPPVIPKTTTPPTAVRQPDIQYTQQALEHEIEGVIVVECVIGTDGTVRDCRVLRSLPYMDRAVVGALERARYKPYTVGGKPVDVAYTFTIRLKLPQ